MGGGGGYKRLNIAVFIRDLLSGVEFKCEMSTLLVDVLLDQYCRSEVVSTRQMSTTVESDILHLSI